MSSKKSGTVKNNSVSNPDKPENKQGSGSASSVNKGNDVDTSDVLKSYREALYGCSQSDMPNTELIAMMGNVLSVMQKIDDRLSRMEAQNTKIEQNTNALTEINKKVSSLSSKVAGLQADTVILENRVNTMENDLQGNSDLFDDLKRTTDSLAADVSTKKFDMSSVKADIESLKLQNKELKEKMLEMRCRSMKYNLIFSGIPEESYENCYITIREFIQEEMQVESDDISFHNVHRIGPKDDPRRNGRPRSIVAKFVFNDDLVRVKRAARNLKDTPYYVSEQFPPEIEEKRKLLYPIAKAERKKKSKVTLVRDKLYVNGQEVVVNPDSTYTHIAANESTPRNSTSRPYKRTRVNSTPDRD